MLTSSLVPLYLFIHHHHLPSFQLVFEYIIYYKGVNTSNLYIEINTINANN